MENSLRCVLLGSLLLSLFSASLGVREQCEVGQHVIEVGKQMQDSKSCTLYKCINYNRKYALETLTCASQTLKNGCRSVAGATKAPFPDCCSTVICKS